MDKEHLLKRIEEIDPSHDVVSIDLTTNSITYSNQIIQHRKITKITGDEEVVRAYFIAKLVKNLGYKLEDIELEKDYEAGRPKTIKPRIDIILRDRRNTKDKTFLFIEVKAPDKYEHDKEYIRTQLFELAKLEDKKSPINYLVYSTVDIEDDKVKESNIIIDYLTYSDFDDWIEKGKLSLNEIQKEYGEPRKVKYVKGKTDLNTKVTKYQFDLLRQDLHDVLWGGGGTNYNEIFVGLVKIFLAKIYDENNTPINEPYKIQIEYIGKIPESAEDVFNKVNNLYLEACKDYLGQSYKELENEGLNRRNISLNKVMYVVEQLQGLSLTINNASGKDILGDFFEGIVTQGFKQDKGQFFTHKNIVKFIIYALGIDDWSIAQLNKSKTLPYICDPACGSGTFLIEVMKVITDTIKRKRRDEISTANDVQQFLAYKMSDVKENTWAWDYLYGIEINSDLALATKVNMVLHGDGSGNIYAKDALLPFNKFENRQKLSLLYSSKRHDNYTYENEVNEQFDFIMSNPPFAAKLDNETKKSLPLTFEYAGQGNSENLFIERWYQLLREGGRIGVVLPESVFDTGENLYIRLFIYKYFWIKQVISLASGKNGAFLPFTPIKTSLLFLEKKSRKDVQDYDKEWSEILSNYNRLKSQVKKIIANQEDTKENRSILAKYLDGYGLNKHNDESIKELLKRHRADIIEVNKYPSWWVFNHISKKYDYKILIAHTKNIGYHKTKNKELKRENSLFSTDSDDQVIVDVNNPQKILDYMKGGKFTNEPNLFEINFSDISKSVSLRLDHRFHRYIIFEEPEILTKYNKSPFLFRDAILGIRNGKDIKREYYSVDATGATLETDYKYVTINNVRPNGFLLDDVINVSSKKGDELSKFKLQANELIITRSGSVGITKVFDLENGDYVYIPSGYLIIVKIDEDILLHDFAESLLNSKIMRKYFDVFGTGKTQRNIAQDDIKRIPIPSLSKDDQRNIVEQYQRTRDKISGEILDKENQIRQLKVELEKVIPDSILSSELTIDIDVED